MGRLTLLIQKHKDKAEKIRVNAANMFFDAKEQGNLNKRRAAVNNTYHEVLFFLFQHHKLTALITASTDTVEESDIKALNNLLTLMAGIVESFPELGVYDCGVTKIQGNTEDRPRRYTI